MYRNVSLFALPINWLLVMLTRVFSIYYIGRHAPKASGASTGDSATMVDGATTAEEEAGSSSSEGPLFDNAAPHSSASRARLQRALPPAVLATYERILAAHYNGLENMAIFFGAVIVGNVARLNALELSLCAWLYVASRLAYVVLYVRVAAGPASNARSAVFGLGVFLCWWLMLRGAVFVLYEYEALH